MEAMTKQELDTVRAKYKGRRILSIAKSNKGEVVVKLGSKKGYR